MPPIPPELAADLYEAYRREWAVSELLDPPNLVDSWSDLPTEQRHFWKVVVERFERNLAEATGLAR